MGVVDIHGLDTNMEYFDSEQNREVIKKYKRTGKKKYKDELVLGNLGLVFNILNDYPRFRHEQLFSFAVEGLIKSIENFDLEKGAAFSTYAHTRIWGEIRRGLNRKIGNKIPRREQRNYYKYKKEKDNNPEKSIEEIAENLELSPSELKNIELFYERASLNFELTVEGGKVNEVIDLIEGSERVDTDIIDLSTIIKELDNTYKTIIRMKMEGFTEKRIGEELEFGQASIWRRFNSFCEEFKRHIRENDEFKFCNLVGY